MDTIVLIYMIMAGFMYLSLNVFILIIAGKSIFFSVLRLITPKGCDIFLVNSNRHISWYYKVPKDGIFRVGGKLYVSNPEKLLSLKEERLDEDKKDIYQKVKQSIEKNRELLKERIKEAVEKQRNILAEVEALRKNGVKEDKLGDYLAVLEQIGKRVNYLQDKLKQQEQIYYHKRRPAFLFIEGDPVPKDLHEWYTDLDSTMIDNVIARSQTKDPKAINDLEKQLKLIKFLLIITIIAAALSAIIAFKNSGDLTNLAQNMGLIK